MLKNRKLSVGIVLLVVIVSLLSFFVSALVFLGWGYLNPRYEIKFDPGSVSAENVKRFDKVRDLLKNEYLEEVDENTLLEGAVSGMADSLGDPYTVYFNKEQMKMFMERSDGSYVGIGVSISMGSDGLLTVIEPFEDSPAKAAGMIQGDKIIKVDDKDVTSIRDEDIIIGMIKGPENTKVKVTVYRPSKGKSIDFEMLRKRIKIVNIKSEMLPGNIGYIKINMFDSEIARYFDEHIQKLLLQGMRGLIIDLRDNPGGSYDQVIKMADRILPRGLIVFTEDRRGKKIEEFSDEKELGVPLGILINGYSASASEILAGAVKDHNKGILLGTKTFGKGLVQVVVPLDDGAGLKMTVAKYFTPSGICIQGIGVQPDEVVEVPEGYANMPVSQIPRADDIQLQTLLEILRARAQ